MVVGVVTPGVYPGWAYKSNRTHMGDVVSVTVVWESDTQCGDDGERARIGYHLLSCAIWYVQRRNPPSGCVMFSIQFCLWPHLVGKPEHCIPPQSVSLLVINGHGYLTGCKVWIPRNGLYHVIIAQAIPQTRFRHPPW